MHGREASTLGFAVILAVVLLGGVIAFAGPRAEPDSAPQVPVAAAAFGDAFWKQWGDGQAEITGYDLVFPRYREARNGTAVTVFVTEPFSERVRVKADPGKHPDEDVFQVMKLNLIRDFPTGVYDYNLMTSAFVGLEPSGGRGAGSTAKVAFSSQEWCGQVFEMALFDRAAVRFTVHSYFDGEADESGSIKVPGDVVAEDTLMLWARGLATPFLERGASTVAPVFRSLATVRLGHVDPAISTATFKRSRETTAVTVPAGTFEAETLEVSIAGGPVWTFQVETSAPRRILSWSSSEGERGTMVGSVRIPYWKMNGTAFDDAVKQFGLSKRPPRTM